MSHLTRAPIDRDALIAELRSEANGALVTFSGDVREPSQGRRTVSISYTAYEEMAQRQLEEIERAARERFAITGLRIMHRLGILAVGETSVFIAAAAQHRAEAFDACRFAIEELKRLVPIWKEEHFRPALDSETAAGHEPLPSGQS